MEKIINYNSKIDSKKRITIRNPKYEYYNVTEHENGIIVLEPRELVSPLEISKNTLSMMDKSVENIKKGKVSKPIKL